MKELVLPNLQPVHQVRILDKHSPPEIDLQNCDSAKEAWKELDAKYGNAANITTVLTDDFFKMVLKSRTEESKLVELKVAVARLSSDLLAVEQSQVLHNNPYAINHIVKLLPRFWQNKYSENKTKLQEGGKSQWEGMISFLKDEAFRLETELPWTLDSFSKKEDNREDEAREESFSSRKEKKRVNSLKKGEREKGGKEEVKKSPRFEEMKAKLGSCPHCKEHHTFIGRSKELMATDNLRNCDTFLSLTPQQRAAVVQKAKVCAQCLSWGHERSDCQRDKRVCGIKQCPLLHNTLLHGTTVGYVNLARSKNKENEIDEGEEKSIKFLHIVSHVFIGKNLRLVILLDDGADISLITIAAAGYLGLRGKRKMTYLMTAGESEARGKYMIHYKLEVTCNDGSVKSVSCIGVDCITAMSI